MKSKYKKIKYTNTGVKAPVVNLMKSSPDLDRSDMIELIYPEIRIIIRRVARKTMYNSAKSLISVCKDGKVNDFYVYDIINDARIVCENLYLIIKKPDLATYVKYGEYKMIYNDMRGVLLHAKES
jgi:hypothetical protein